MMPPHESTVYGLTTSRLEAFSDGVLAIVITLLILGVTEEQKDIIAGLPLGELNQRLLAVWPDVLSFAISFMLVAIYWILHHIMFHYIHVADRMLLWLNIVFLLLVAFIPFPTDLLAEGYPHETNTIIVLYALSHMLTGLSLAALWGYATWNHRLVPKHMDARVVRGILRAVLVGPVLYAAGLAVSFLHHQAALLMFMLIPFYYVIPGRIDSHWMTLGHRATPSQGTPPEP